MKQLPDVSASTEEKVAFHQRLEAASQEEMAVLPRTVDGKTVVWAPHPGSQERFLGCPIFEAFLHGNRGGGKGLPLDEPVYTPWGAVPISKIHVGSHVLCPDGTKSTVIGVFPQGVRPVFRLEFDDGSAARCDDHHIWAIHVQENPTKRSYPYRLMTMDKVLEKFENTKQRLHVPTLDAPANLHRPWRSSVHPIPPYVLGLLLGDGCFTQGRVMFCTEHDELAEVVLEAGMTESKMDSRRYLRNFLARQLWGAAISKLSLAEKRSGEKFVPAAYMGLQPEHRLAVLQGLLDTDGTVDTEGRVSFCSKSEQLARDVQQLVWSLGGKATVTEKVIDAGTYYNVYIQTGSKFEPFRLRKKAERVTPYQHPRLWRRIVKIEREEPRETVCIKIDHPLGLFMTRDYVVTHNTDSLIMSYARYVGRGYGSAWRGILFRQSYPQLADVVAKTRKWFHRIFPAAKFNETKMVWSFPGGEMLLLRHIEKPADYWKYHGHEYPWIGWEELPNWPDDECFKLMFSCCRSATKGVPRMIRGTGNPAGPGHGWVADRYLLRGGGWRMEQYQEAPIDVSGKKLPARVAIPSRLHENVALLDAVPDYLESIQAAARNPAMAEAWTTGSWDVVAGGMFDDVWNPAINVVPEFVVPHSWRVDRAFDWGSSKPFSVGWYAESDGTDVTLLDGRRVRTVRGDIFRIAEWYGWTGKPNEGRRMLAVDVAKGIVEKELGLGLRGGDRRVAPGPADSAIWVEENGPSIASDMARHVKLSGVRYGGVHWTKADKRPGSRMKGWERLRAMMRGAHPPETGVRETPGFFVVGPKNPQFLRTVLTLPRSEKNPDDIDTDSEDHIADEVRYRVASGGVRVAQGKTSGIY